VCVNVLSDKQTKISEAIFSSSNKNECVLVVDKIK